MLNDYRNYQQPTQVFSRFETPATAYPSIKSKGGGIGSSPYTSQQTPLSMIMGSAGGSGGGGAGGMDILSMLMSIFGGTQKITNDNSGQPATYGPTGGIWT
jgi:hypothetical protein